MRNLIISYDLKKPGQDYATVIDKVKSLGNWAHIHGSVWYVRSEFTASAARDAIVGILSANDTVIVVDASNNNAAWHGLSSEVATFVREKWVAQSARLSA